MPNVQISDLSALSSPAASDVLAADKADGSSTGKLTLAQAATVGGAGVYLPVGSESNGFTTIVVSGQSNVVADSVTDTLTLVAGTNVTITTNASTDTITINASGGGGALSDGDYGDVTVSGTGTVITIDNDVVTYAKMQNVSATDKLLGRSTSGSGDVEEITCTAAARSILDDTTTGAILTTLGAAPAANPTFTGTVTIPTVAGTSDSTTKAASTAFVQAVVAASVVGLWEFKGSTDCSSNPNYPSASQGDLYRVSVAGKIGGASGKVVEVGDFYVAIADNAGGTEASVGTSWTVFQGNLSGALLTGDIGTTVQPLDSDLTAIAALTTTTIGRSLLAAGNAGAIATIAALGNGDSPTWTGGLFTGNLTVNGNCDFLGITKMESTVVRVPVTQTALTTDTTLWSPTAGAKALMSATGGTVHIKSMAAGANGEERDYLNVGSQTMIFDHDITSGTTPANRFCAVGATVGGTEVSGVSVGPGEWVHFDYINDGTNSRWRVQ